MKEQTTVIVGGGVIGLCTALHLAKSDPVSASAGSIVVCDVFSKTFEGTSASNTGCLHYGYSSSEEDLLQLGIYSFGLWKALGQDPEFRKETGFRLHSFFAVSEGHGDGQELLPNWVSSETYWDVSQISLGVHNASMSACASNTFEQLTYIFLVIQKLLAFGLRGNVLVLGLKSALLPGSSQQYSHLITNSNMLIVKPTPAHVFRFNAKFWCSPREPGPQLYLSNYFHHRP